MIRYTAACYFHHKSTIDRRYKAYLVNFCHQHNLVQPETAGAERPFGIQVTLPANDTLRNVLGDDWEQLHWYTSETERDRAYENMATRHGYYRSSDSPTQVLTKIRR